MTPPRFNIGDKVRLKDPFERPSNAWRNLEPGRIYEVNAHYYTKIGLVGTSLDDSWEAILFEKVEPAEFHTEYMGIFADDPVRKRLKEIAYDYLQQTEDYDQVVCSSRKGKMAMPLTREEHKLSNQHATLCWQRAIQRVLEEGLGGRGYSLWEARQAIEHRFEQEYEYQPLREKKL